MNPDYVEMLAALSEAGAEYLVVGAYAMAAHGVPRATGDLDLWVRATPENADRVWTALERFGAPLSELTPGDLAAPDVVYQIGVAPARIDFLTEISGVTFEQAWPERFTVRIEGLDVPVIGRRALLENKRAVGRPRDLADVAELREADAREDDRP